MSEENKNENLEEVKETKDEELLSEVLQKEDEKNAPTPIKGEKHSKLLYFIIAILLLIIGCTIVILVLNNFSE